MTTLPSDAYVRFGRGRRGRGPVLRAADRPQHVHCHTLRRSRADPGDLTTRTSDMAITVPGQGQVTEDDVTLAGCWPRP